MAKQKFYVVWKGRQTGVFETWDDCKAQTDKFPKAVYKSFKTRQLAEQAFKDEWWEYIGKDIFETELTEEQLLLVGNPIEESISVDGAWNTSTGVVEYQGVHTKTKELIFKVGPLEDGTNNIVEFLGIVHALAHCKKKTSHFQFILTAETQSVGFGIRKQEQIIIAATKTKNFLSF